MRVSTIATNLALCLSAFASPLEERATRCDNANINVIENNQNSPVAFCYSYLSTTQKTSPFSKLKPSAVSSACKCITSSATACTATSTKIRTSTVTDTLVITKPKYKTQTVISVQTSVSTKTKTVPASTVTISKTAVTTVLGSAKPKIVTSISTVTVSAPVIPAKTSTSLKTITVTPPAISAKIVTSISTVTVSSPAVSAKPLISTITVVPDFCTLSGSSTQLPSVSSSVLTSISASSSPSTPAASQSLTVISGLIRASGGAVDGQYLQSDFPNLGFLFSDSNGPLSPVNFTFDAATSYVYLLGPDTPSYLAFKPAIDENDLYNLGDSNFLNGENTRLNCSINSDTVELTCAGTRTDGAIKQYFQSAGHFSDYLLDLVPADEVDQGTLQSIKLFVELDADSAPLTNGSNSPTSSTSASTSTATSSTSTTSSATSTSYPTPTSNVLNCKTTVQNSSTYYVQVSGTGLNIDGSIMISFAGDNAGVNWFMASNTTKFESGAAPQAVIYNPSTKTLSNGYNPLVMREGFMYWGHPYAPTVALSCDVTGSEMILACSATVDGETTTDLKLLDGGQSGEYQVFLAGHDVTYNDQYQASYLPAATFRLVAPCAS